MRWLKVHGFYSTRESIFSVLVSGISKLLPLFWNRVSAAAKVKESYLALIKPIAEKYSLLLDGQNISSSPAASIGNLTVQWTSVNAPSPISPFSQDSVFWKIFSRAVQAAFGEEVITAPSAMTGNTGEHTSRNDLHSFMLQCRWDTRFYVSPSHWISLQFLSFRLNYIISGTCRRTFTGGAQRE